MKICSPCATAITNDDYSHLTECAANVIHAFLAKHGHVTISDNEATGSWTWESCNVCHYGVQTLYVAEVTA